MPPKAKRAKSQVEIADPVNITSSGRKIVTIADDAPIVLKKCKKLHEELKIKAQQPKKSIHSNDEAIESFADAMPRLK